MSSAKTYFISGASRGLGYVYTRELLASSPQVRVVAGARNPASAQQLHDLAAEPANKGRLEIIAFDVDHEDKVREAASELEKSEFVKESGLDTIIVNAGVFVGGHKTPAELTLDDLRGNWRTNVEGAILTVHYLRPLLERGKAKQIFFITSITGSAQGFYSQLPNGVSYSISKAALNMYGIKLAREVADKGYTVLLIHPGYVKTDINKADGGGDLTPEEAATLATKNIFLAATPEWNGRYLDWEGKTVPW